MMTQKMLSDYGIYSPINQKIRNMRTEKNKMTTLRQAAKKYESKTTKNISELKSVNTELDIQTKEFTDSEGKIFKIKTVEIEGEEYRIPDSVIKQLKEMIEEKPSMTEFKVKKSGEGLKTSYTVIPLD